jgi:hypothetical protein
VGAHLDLGGRLFGFVRSGAGGARTLGLVDAIDALCQLSYSPRKLIFGGPV